MAYTAEINATTTHEKYRTIPHLHLLVTASEKKRKKKANHRDSSAKGKDIPERPVQTRATRVSVRTLLIRNYHDHDKESFPREKIAAVCLLESTTDYRVFSRITVRSNLPP